MNDSTLYSIGHGNKTIEKLIDELKSFNIEYLVDVRTKPYSRWNPHFNKDSLQAILKKYGIRYLFLGNEIGGLPSDESCYTEDGKIDYSLVKNKDFFKKGINRLLTANSKKIKIATMCSETNPEECHRSKLIGKELLLRGVNTKHILEIDKIKTQSTINTILFGLFANNEDFDLSSKKSYR